MMNPTLLATAFDAVAIALVNPDQQRIIAEYAFRHVESLLPELACSEQVAISDQDPTLTWLAPGEYLISEIEAGLARATSVDARDATSSSGVGIYTDRLPLDQEAFNAGYLKWLREDFSVASPDAYNTLRAFAKSKSVPIESVLDCTKGLELIACRARAGFSCCRFDVRPALMAERITLHAKAIKAAANTRLLRALATTRMPLPARTILTQIVSQPGRRSVFVSISDTPHDPAVLNQGCGALLFELDALNRISLYGLSATDIMRRSAAILTRTCRVTMRTDKSADDGDLPLTLDDYRYQDFSCLVEPVSR